MWMKCISGVVALFLLFASSLNADGFFYQLPQDRSWIRFEMQVTAENGGMQQSRPAKLTMASVGQVADPCRWIESKIQMTKNEVEQTIVTTLLIPEPL